MRADSCISALAVILGNVLASTAVWEKKEEEVKGGYDKGSG